MINRRLCQLASFVMVLCAPLSTALAQDHITITSPAGGEVWEVGSTQQITWDTNLQDVVIRFSADNGATWSVVEPTVDTNHAGWLDYAWTVPDAVSTECVIHIEGYNGEVPTDSSAFEIKAAADTGNGDGGGGDDDDGGGCAALSAKAGLASWTLAVLALALTLLSRRRRHRR